MNRLGMYSTSLMILAPTPWLLQHVAQHHVYTNEENDIDIHHFDPLIRVSRRSKWASAFKFQWLTVFLVLCSSTGHLLFIVPMDLITGLRDAVTGKQRYEECPNHQDFVAGFKLTILAELAITPLWILFNIYVQGFSEAWWRIALAYSISSYGFLFLTQGAHVNEVCDVPAEPGSSWARRQVETSMNFHPRSPFWHAFTGGLNVQALHHLLPGISSTHYIDMWPQFEKLCKKHGVALKMAPGGVSFAKGFIGHVFELSKNDSLHGS